MSHTAKNLISNLSVDCVVFGFRNNRLEVLLIKRKRNPIKERWALPGGFILADETLDDAAIRILEETSNVKNIYLEQVHTFGAVNRFPARRVVTVAYFALIDPEKHSLKPGIDTTDAQWFNVTETKGMPFDHDDILNKALIQLRQSVRFKPIGFELLPIKFTLTHLQTLYESIIGMHLDKRNFRKKILKTGLLIPLEEFQKGVSHRAAQLYKFDLHKYKKLVKNDYSFQI